MVSRISRDELRALIDRSAPFVLLEALPPIYFEDAHLPGAQNMPHDQVDALAPVLIPDRSTEVVVYCANEPCPNSGIAARRLVALGYANVREYAEGKEDWVAAGLPVERGAATLVR
ncbi:MAG TPA: rhodanese-like domain-containing protein [Chloroflexota bacterium]|nr:rhodanese-like domain-containing protein [Chloroflexota bacterium]